MPNTNGPAAATGGNPGAPTPLALSGLPDRVRVHALAKLLDLSSRDVVDALAGLGEEGRSAQSSLDRELALKVAELLLGDRGPQPGPEPNAAPDPAPPVTPEPEAAT